MTWQSEWGRPDLNKAARDAHPMPDLPMQALGYLDALYVLKGDRLNTQQGRMAFIPFTAIDRYASRFISPLEYEHFVDMIVAIDTQYVNEENLRAQKRAENGRHKNNQNHTGRKPSR